MEAGQRDKAVIDARHVDVLDGVRALAILIVCWYHIWQQSWLAPVIRAPWLMKLTGRALISFDVVPRTGYLFVDCMLFLSAFLLFLPHARARLMGEVPPDIGSFYKKRLIRIVPCYWLCVLVIFFGYSLPAGEFRTPGGALGELLANLTFTQTFFPQYYLHSKINGVLWTVVIEMQFYLLFPFLAAAFRKRPVLTYGAMAGLAFAYIYLFALKQPEAKLPFLVNQLPSFFGVFANGMAASLVFTRIAKNCRRNRWLSAGCTLLAVASIFLLVRLLHLAAAAKPLQVFQLRGRFALSLVFAVFSVSSALAAGWFRFLLSNRVIGFMAGISFNLYMWHQWLAVRLKQWRIPYWEGEELPNMAGNIAWQRQYTLLCFALSIIAAALVTYLIERPLAKRLQARLMK